MGFDALGFDEFRTGSAEFCASGFEFCTGSKALYKWISILNRDGNVCRNRVEFYTCTGSFEHANEFCTYPDGFQIPFAQQYRTSTVPGNLGQDSFIREGSNFVFEVFCIGFRVLYS